MGYNTLDEFVKAVIPESVLDKNALVYEGKSLDQPKSEYKFS